jgi:hypothetical protein
MPAILRGAAVGLALAAALLAACGGPERAILPPPPPPPEQPDTTRPAGPPPLVTRPLTLELVGTGFAQPLYLTAPPGDARMFVVERGGLVKVMKNGVTLQHPFIDVTPTIDVFGPERGMLSLAFHPRFAQNGFVFLAYTAYGGDIVVMRYRVPAATPDRADPGSAMEVIRILHPYAVHNGGQLAFGPDGMLYLSTGDGGTDGDSEGNAQNLESLLGKILRLDVDAATPYAIPRDNPFLRRPSARGEIWALGLRNPWRMTFDAHTGMLFVADVGEREREELNVVPANRGGYNFGWNVMEGSTCFGLNPDCALPGFTRPDLEYTHREPCTSVTGGFVYRGSTLPGHAGRYFFGDYCQGWIRSIRMDGDRIDEYVDWTIASRFGLQSFGIDGLGELYALYADGAIYRIGRGD